MFISEFLCRVALLVISVNAQPTGTVISRRYASCGNGQILEKVKRVPVRVPASCGNGQILAKEKRISIRVPARCGNGQILVKEKRISIRVPAWCGNGQILVKEKHVLSGFLCGVETDRY